MNSDTLIEKTKTGKGKKVEVNVTLTRTYRGVYLLESNTDESRNVVELAVQEDLFNGSDNLEYMTEHISIGIGKKVSNERAEKILCSLPELEYLSGRAREQAIEIINNIIG